MSTSVATVKTSEQEGKPGIEVPPIRPWRKDEDKDMNPKDRVQKYGTYMEEAVDSGMKAAIEFVKKHPDWNDKAYLVFDGPFLMRPFVTTEKEAKTGINEFGVVIGPPVDAFCYVVQVSAIKNLIARNNGITNQAPVAVDTTSEIMLNSTVQIILANLIVFLVAMNASFAVWVLGLFLFFLLLSHISSTSTQLKDKSLVVDTTLGILSFLFILILFLTVICIGYSFKENYSILCQQVSPNGTHSEISWSVQEQIDYVPWNSFSLFKLSGVSPTYGVYGKLINENGLINSYYSRLGLVDFPMIYKNVLPYTMNFVYDNNATILTDVEIVTCKSTNVCPVQKELSFHRVCTKK